MKKVSSIILFSSIALMTGCTEPGRTTTVGAATGGVIGAGLGAIVGNQAGSPGAGLVIGAAAGAAAGGAVGNALESHEKKLAEHDAVLARKDETIKTQQAEITQLRTIKNDDVVSQPSHRGDSYAWNGSKHADGAGVRYATASEIAAARAGLRAPAAAPRAQLNTASPAVSAAVQPSLPKSSVSEKNLVEEIKPNTVSPALPSTITASLAPAAEGDECASATGEVNKANNANDSADKLFHLRRALRMCPSNAQYHNQLGELYLTLNRSDDAKYEFNEALKLDPAHQDAIRNLEKINTPAKTNRY